MTGAGAGTGAVMGVPSTGSCFPTVCVVGSTRSTGYVELNEFTFIGMFASHLEFLKGFFLFFFDLLFLTQK